MRIAPIRASSVLGAALLVSLATANAAAEVAASGAYTTSISVDVPPFYGVEPSIDLVYSSSGGAGLAGFGWHLVAGSRIERLSAGGGSPRLADDDVFQVDGVRLLPCTSTSSASCASSGTHAFAGETFLRVQSDPNANLWRITDRDGTVRTFQPVLFGSTTWRTTTTWMLASVETIAGHVVRYERWCDGNLECYVSRVSYGEGRACRGEGNPDLPPGAAVPGGVVELHWEARPDEIESADTGHRRAIRYRLASIDVRHGLGRLRTYELAYALTPTGQSSALSRVDRYGEDAVLAGTGRVVSGTRAPGRSFSTEADPVALSAATPTPGGATIDLTSIGGANLAPTWPPVEMPPGREIETADFDGDRRPDVMSWDVDDQCETLTLNLWLAGANDYITSQVTLPALQNCSFEGHAADLDGDGRADLLIDNLYLVGDPLLNTYSRELISVLRVADAGWRALPTAFQTGVLIQPGIVPAPCAIGDLDGDARADYVCESVNNKLFVSRAKIDGGFANFEIPRPPLSMLHHFVMFDVDGDRRDDLVFAEHHTAAHHSACGPTDYCGHWALRVAVSRGGAAPMWELQETTEFSTFGPDYQATQLTPGDYDGDGRADLALSTMNNDGNGAGIVLALNRPQSTGRWQLSHQSVNNLKGAVSSGDFNNDGADDLFIALTHGPHAAGACEGQIDHFHHLLVVAPSTRTGFAFPANPRDPCSGVDSPFEMGEVEYMDNGRGARGVDVNGDGTAEWMLLTSGTTGVRISDVPGKHAGPAFGSLRPGDLDGDGRIDWVTVGFLNQGIEVIAIHTQADGSVRQHRRAYTSSLFGEATTPHQVQTWFFIDVGSLDGHTDGHDDLVIVDPVTRVITTLLSTGDGGWEQRTVFHGLPLSREVPVWRALDLDGDGARDLVQLYYLEVNGIPTVRASTLRSNREGQWLPDAGDYFALESHDRTTAQFKVADVDGDGRDDLVHVGSTPFAFGPSNTQIRVLRSRGDGRFDPITTWLHQPRDDRGHYTPTDLDGDGRTDFALAGTDGYVHALMSNGDGTYGYRAVPHGLAAALTEWGEHAFADLDRDGRSDLVHLQATAIGTLSVTLGWARTGTFVRQDIAQTNLPGRDLPRVTLADADSDGDLDLVQAAPGLHRWRFRVSRPVMRADLSELGARVQITYGSSAGAHERMPGGMIVTPVTRLEVFDGRATRPVETTSYTHRRAYFSFEERRFLGFESREIRHPRSLEVETFWLDRWCGAQSQATEIRTTTGRLVSSVETVFLGTSSPDEPTICLPETETTSECEGDDERSCRRVRSEFTYDLYGNRVRVIERGDVTSPADDRMEESVVVPNPDRYLVNRTASVTRSQAEQDASGRWGWRLLTERRYVYDDNGDYLDSPKRGLVHEQHDWDDNQGRFLLTMFRHDDAGNVLQVNGPPTPHAPSGHAQSWTYDCTYGRFAVNACDAVTCTSTIWDLDHVRPSKTIDTNAVETSYVHDALGRRTEVTKAGGRFERTMYPPPSTWGTANQHVAVERSDGSSDGKLTTRTYFDGLGRTYRVWTEGDSNVTQELDGASTRVAAVSVPTIGPAAPSLWTRTTFDAANRPLRVTLPDGRVRTTAYGVGTLTQTNERGGTKIAHVDGHGRIAAIEELLRLCPYEVPEACADTKHFVTRYGYDGADRLTWIVDDMGNVTHSVYDSLGRRLWHSSPDGGDEVVTYADDGLPVAFTDITGARREVVYDIAGRPIARATFDAAGNSTRHVEYLWDVDPATNMPRGASLGRLVGELDASDARYEKLLTWSSDGEVTHMRECTDGNCVEHRRDYDVAGRLASITYPDNSGAISSASEVVLYEYAEDGRLARIPGYLDEVIYDEFGMPSKLSFANGVTEGRMHNPTRGWLDRVIVKGPAGTLLDVSVARDPAGGVNQLTTTGVSYTAQEQYRRDDLGRLLSIASTDPYSSSTHEYDSIGRMTVDSRRGQIEYRDARHAHAMTSTSSGDDYKYDDRGQLVADARRELSWNPDGQLVEVTERVTGAWTRFAYGVDGARLSSTDATGTTYTFGNLIELDPQDGVVTNIVALGRTLARKDAHGNVEFLHADHLESVRAVTDVRGSLVKETDFDAWGRARGVNGTSHSDLGFAGERTSEAIGLVHMGARYYDHALAQMISPDTYIPDPFTPQTLNPYAYVMNDPVTMIDPTGHEGDDLWPIWMPVHLFEDEPRWRAPPPAPQCSVQGLTMEEHLARQDLNAGATPEERAARERLDEDERINTFIVNNIAKPVAGLNRLFAVVDPTSLLDIVLDKADENMGWGDSSDFVGGAVPLTIAGMLIPSKTPFKAPKLYRLVTKKRAVDRVLKIRIPLGALKSGEKRLVQQKYAMANRLIREGTIDARIGSKFDYHYRQSQEFVKYYDDVDGPLSKVRIPEGFDVDEFVPRAHGGPPLMFNQHLMPSLLNRSLGGWEQAAERAAKVQPGDRILEYMVEFY